MLGYEFVFLGGVNSSYLFQANSGTYYFLDFKPSPYLIEKINPHLSTLVFEFVLGVFQDENLKPSNDEKIGMTVANIMADFFSKNNQNVVIYICETKDNRQEARMRKFDTWFHRYHDQSFVKLDEVLVDSQQNRFPISILLKNTNPYRLELIDAFMSIAKMNK